MKVCKVFLPTACAVGLMLVNPAANAQQAKPGSPALAPALNAAAAPAIPSAPEQKSPAATSTRAKGAAADVLDMGKLEVVTERYADGKVKIEREVGQDAAGNYINQGMFKLYSPSGEVLKAGEFLNGKQQGKWTQQLLRDDAHLFSASQDKQLPGPFTSEATFQDGHLHGTWTIKDSHGQNIVQWNFDNGTPAGTWTWWHSNGQKRLEATFVNGALNGDVLEWDTDGKTVNQIAYVDGKCVVKTVGWYTLGRKRYEGTYLRAANMPEANYDWWNNKITMAASAGRRRPAARPLDRVVSQRQQENRRAVRSRRLGGQDHLVVRERPAAG